MSSKNQQIYFIITIIINISIIIIIKQNELYKVYANKGK